jgi:hypothetical protein
MIVPLRFIIRAPILRDKPKQITPEKSTKRGVFGQIDSARKVGPTFVVNRLRTRARTSVPSLVP